jgi:membrane-bound serine protease (ClpP class)
VLRASFRDFADRNGYPQALAEAMVSVDLEVHKVTIAGEVNPRYVKAERATALKQEFGDKVLADEIVLPRGRLLTMVANEAFEYGFARAVVTSEKGLLVYYGAEQAQVTEIRSSWSEELVRFLDLIGPLLLAAGLLGLYLEFKTPGFGLPGIVGITCLVLYFGSKYLVGLADVVDILLFFTGVVLVGVEVFLIPGFGIVGVTGIVLILTGLFLSVQPGSFIIPRTPAETEALASGFVQLLLAFVIVLAGAFLLGRYLPHLPLVGRLVLTTEPVGAKVFSSGALTEYKLRKLVGARGVATTLCRPAGKAVFGNELIDVVAQAEYIKRGQEVEVLALEGNRVIIRPLPAPAEPSAEEA